MARPGELMDMRLRNARSATDLYAFMRDTYDPEYIHGRDAALYDAFSRVLAPISTRVQQAKTLGDILSGASDEDRASALVHLFVENAVADPLHPAVADAILRLGTLPHDFFESVIHLEGLRSTYPGEALELLLTHDPARRLLRILKSCPASALSKYLPAASAVNLQTKKDLAGFLAEHRTTDDLDVYLNDIVEDAEVFRVEAEDWVELLHAARTTRARLELMHVARYAKESTASATDHPLAHVLSDPRFGREHAGLTAMFLGPAGSRTRDPEPIHFKWEKGGRKPTPKSKSKSKSRRNK